MRGYLRDHWGMLGREIGREWPGIPNEELHWVEGDLDRLVAIIQLYYGMTTEEAIEQIGAFLHRVKA
jgi:hypothetical protein